MEQVVIVADEKSTLYTELGTELKNRLGASRKCEAILWGLQQYRDNKATSLSSQNFIFIGENDASRPNVSSINWKYKWNNLYYGWVGSIAMIDVEYQSYTKAQMNEFKNLCKRQEIEITKLSATSDDGPVLPGFDNVANGIASVLTVILAPVLLPFAVPWAIASVLKDDKALLKAQYSFLINEFLLHAVDEYLAGRGA